MKIRWSDCIRTLAVIGALGLAAAAGEALAQPYPNKPIKIVIPAAPGGGADIVGRLIGPRLAERLGQPVVMDYRAGAGGIIATESVARAPADGYTLLMGYIGTLGVYPGLYQKLSYDPLRDFAPVAFLAAIPSILVVHPSVPANTVPELIALAKAKPGTLNYASGGSATAPHLAGELFKSLARVDLVHVPYKGSGPAMNDMLGGQVSVMFNTMVQTIPYVQSGRLKALAVTGAKRSAALPNVPTVAEAGVAGYEIVGWFGIVAPAGTPREIVARLNAEILAVLAEPQLKEQMTALGSEPTDIRTPEQFGGFMRNEISKWTQVVKESGMKAE
jgi:tripartite-type tricarboxylate transporter receptor subunit TctC